MIAFLLALLLTTAAFAEPVNTSCPVHWQSLSGGYHSGPIEDLLPGPPSSNFQLPAPPPARRQIHTYAEALDHLADQKVPLSEMPVAKASTKVKDVPFGKFRNGKEEFDYASVDPAAKKLTHGHEIFFGRGAKSVEEAKKIVARYFTEGLERSDASGHFDIYRHQNDTETVSGKKTIKDSATSGFSNGSEQYAKAEFFARNKEVSGIIFVIDVKDQEILNLNEWHKSRGITHIPYGEEREILLKGGRSPQRVRAAIVYEDGKPVAIYTNPNYQPSGGAK